MKTGIIYCPRHSDHKSEKKRWQKIAASLEKHGIEYDLVQSENPQSVSRIVGMLAHNGYDTIVMCGGDSALNSAVNCLMREEKDLRENITLGVIPNGVMNDFAHFWGLSEKNIETAVEALKVRRVRKVDVGCLYFTDKKAQKQVRYFLNCVNVGLIASIQRLRNTTTKWLWSRTIAYVASFVLLLFHRMFWKMQYTINYETEQHRVMSLCCGSALGFGQTPNAVPYNGMLDMTVIRHLHLTQIFAGIGLFLRGKILNHNAIFPYRGREIELVLPKDTPVSVDGHYLDDITTFDNPLKLMVEQEAVNFIIEA